MPKQQSEIDWTTLRDEYIMSDISIKKLAEKHGVSYSALTKRSQAEWWARQRFERDGLGRDKLMEYAADVEVDRRKKIEDVTDRVLDYIADHLSELMTTASNCKDIVIAIEKLRAIKGIKSDLDVEEQIARINKLKKDTETDESDKTIKVVIADELEEYAN